MLTEALSTGPAGDLSWRTWPLRAGNSPFTGRLGQLNSGQLSKLASLGKGQKASSCDQGRWEGLAHRASSLLRGNWSPVWEGLLNPRQASQASQGLHYLWTHPRAQSIPRGACLLPD